jgi:F0F1-type ATP synthase assembly protein I
MPQDAAYHRLAYKIFAEFTGTIAVPAVLGALLGKWLDERYGTEPRYIIILLAFAFVSSAIIIVKKAKKYRDEYEAIIKKEDNIDLTL